MTNAYVVTGTLTDARTVALDEPLPLPAGRVRVVVEEAPAPAAQPNFRQVLGRIWAEQNARGFLPPTAEEVEERVRDVRKGWDG